MTDATVQLAAQTRIDTVATGFFTDARRLRSDYAGIAWIGGEPDAETGLMGPEYKRREVDARLFLPDTHWYDLDALSDVEVQLSVGLLQVPGTAQGTQGLVGAIADPVIEFYEHPEGGTGVGLCLWVHGTIWSNVGLTYRVTVLCAPDAVREPGAESDGGGGHADSSPVSGDSDGGGGGGGE
ncbi:hypothetical protein BDK92_1219 [Micromonospora pisi]|uniref:Uncharacterized protein n=1 Tax=Micromonospora pisi TaxID=589240 RepID=A0A495JDF2_9ACTN|nr:hypothetical protein [Micromonospora pisi]RKR86947.1 hypothetical protein BDK92_1219 [Micromonospora pisi]